MSKHLKQLSEAGYVEVERFSKGGRSHVRVGLTNSGYKAYVGHVATLLAMTDETIQCRE
nr:transcriptional regulator [Nesterenkonia massiliensis]